MQMTVSLETPAFPTIDDEFEGRGEWWLPNDLDTRIPGMLTIKQGEPRLILFGMFPLATGNLPGPTAFVPEIVHGQMTSGTEITLYRAIPIRQNFGIGPPLVEYSAEWAAIGSHLSNAATFSRVSISFSGVDKWVFPSPIVESHEGWHGSPTSPFRASMAYKPPPEMHIPILSRGVDVVLDCRFYTSGDPWTKVWSCETVFDVVAAKAEPLRWHFAFREELRSLLALLVGEPIFTKRFELVDGPIPTALYHEQRGGRRPSFRNMSQASDVLFTLDDVCAAGLPDRFCQGFDVLSRFKPTVDLYLGTVYPPATLVEFEFIALTQALESFHRRRFIGRYATDEEYERIVGPMVSAIPITAPRELKAKLSAILRFGNEFSLRKRINDILAEITDAELALLSSNKRSELRDRIVEARNFWTHHPIDAAGAPLKGRDLYNMNMRYPFGQSRSRQRRRAGVVVEG